MSGSWGIELEAVLVFGSRAAAGKNSNSKQEAPEEVSTSQPSSSYGAAYIVL
jgi:hypothetical protein